MNFKFFPGDEAWVIKDGVARKVGIQDVTVEFCMAPNGIGRKHIYHVCTRAGRDEPSRNINCLADMLFKTEAEAIEWLSKSLARKKTMAPGPGNRAENMRMCNFCGTGFILARGNYSGEIKLYVRDDKVSFAVQFNVCPSCMETLLTYNIPDDY